EARRRKELADRRVEISCERCGEHFGHMQVELRQLRDEDRWRWWRRRAGLLRFDRAVVRELGRGFYQGGLHQQPAVQGRRYSDVEHGAAKNGAADCVELVAGSGADREDR